MRKPTPKINFTKRAIEALPIPALGQPVAVYRDAKTPGLCLRITDHGKRTFQIYRTLNGRPIRVGVGTFPVMSVEQAHRRAAELNAQINDGINPNVEKKAQRGEMVFGELFGLYMIRHAKVHKRSWEGDQAQFDRYLKPWTKRQLSTIRKADIQALHAKVGSDTGTYAANRLLALLSTVFNRARDWGFDLPNPAQGVKKFREQSRERFLQADELPRFFQSLAAEGNQTIRDYFLVALLTGARRNNVLTMRWDAINLERGTWTIPQTKTGDAQTVPLVPDVVAILQARNVFATSPWVFPGHGSTGHLVEPRKAWERILERAGIENLRIHDLRRSLGSWQAATGANLSIIGKSLGHRNVSTTAIYARLELDPVRAAMEAATQAMLAAAGIGEEPAVVRLNPRKSG